MVLLYSAPLSFVKWRIIDDLNDDDDDDELPVHDDELNVDILAVLVQEIRHKVGHGLVRDVTAQYDMSTHAQLLRSVR